MSALLFALFMLALCAWLQAERVIAHQRKAIVMSESVIEAQRIAVEELQEAVHQLCTMDSPDLKVIAGWGAQIH